MGLMVEKTATDYSKYFHTRWPVNRMYIKSILSAIKKHAEAKLGIVLNLEYDEQDIWIRIDGYSFIISILFLLDRLKLETNNTSFACIISSNGKFINFDLVWEGKQIQMDLLRRWDQSFVSIESEGLPITLKDICKYHEIKMWSYTVQESNQSYLRLLIPLSKDTDQKIRRSLTVLPKGRPEFFDFDLFNQPGQNQELDHYRLSEISYTVFDTETTGLDPSGGDEIISIGAVRIVNNRILREDTFNKLIDPQRSIPEESIQIHGIQPEILKNQPVIVDVLPVFKDFTEDTVLVAHNAAFDMRMLQIKEKTTGIVFENPVLDTMLLSAVIHPGQQGHSLESIAFRLGVKINGRHTALGDAMATGEIFIKQIPLLNKMGIYTLKQARIASQKTYYSRLKY